MVGLEVFEITLKPGTGYKDFDHMTWYVGNARQAASYYTTRMNFTPIAYKGPENGSPYTASYIVQNGGVRFVFVAPVCTPSNQCIPGVERKRLKEIHDHLAKHGDGVKDIALQVNMDVKGIWEKAIKHDAHPVMEPVVINAEAPFSGKIQIATISAYGDTTHTFVNREGYTGPFLPGYQTVEEKDPINRCLPAIDFIGIDHCVGNQPWDGVDEVVKFYEECLNFHRYWTVDDAAMCSDYSAMRSIVVASPDEVIKMPINEPAVGEKKSQIEEFVDYYNGSGVQHIAFRTSDIITAVTNLRARGMEFLSVPSTYYTAIREKLSQSYTVVNESLDILQKLNILIDFDKGGYLLQIFSKHVLDRPTVFVEIIQRNNFDGFGAGNFRALFEAFEREQALRGNL
ncbi:4-hydroxyphenylpyruvate dioxygenase [Uncinocarpus reesii 1704]|uniref:4-hydroxyphenylpyruvate dioxygenase n=1 Tax=Uncinocarpus reesii (strain UAMH 1704) TaxID=336963 RepID=C4JRP1_UNCRE|nr:4-hydroxyphenylpyruvate dioxygenase [Uncinocarpus reesii 1704]EEP80288.1 4-hydroxyphenylpyruvate dioxygenase [Uncinocarpus reesii 1704]